MTMPTPHDTTAANANPIAAPALPVLVSWSGGKDSTWMLARLLDDPGVQVIGLLTSVSTVYDRVSIHGVRRSILRRQADALGLPLFEVTLGATSSNEDYEAAFARGLAMVQAAHPTCATIAFGDLFLEDVRAWRDALVARHGWQALYPLWGEPTPALAQAFVTAGYDAWLSCVDTTQLDASFVGRRYDAALLAALPPGVDPCGERGEFHTCVVNGPIFRAAIPVMTGERVLREERFAYSDLVETDRPPATAP